MRLRWCKLTSSDYSIPQFSDEARKNEVILAKINLFPTLFSFPEVISRVFRLLFVLEWSQYRRFALP